MATRAMLSWQGVESRFPKPKSQTNIIEQVNQPSTLPHGHSQARRFKGSKSLLAQTTVLKQKPSATFRSNLNPPPFPTTTEQQRCKYV